MNFVIYFRLNFILVYDFALNRLKCDIFTPTMYNDGTCIFRVENINCITNKL